jgi:peptidoglycan/LPS O-acetylase OafA/YrhL
LVLVAQKVGYLEGLRGVAALFVVIFHFLEMSYPRVLQNDFFNFFFNGFFSVCLFFVLSAYVLTFKYFQTQDPQIAKSGAVRRYFRLLPVVAISIFAACLLLQSDIFIGALLYPYTTYVTSTYANFMTMHGILVLTAPNWHLAVWNVFFQVFFLGANPYVPSLWTIQIEFLGSMVVYAFALLFGSWRNRWIIYPLMFIAFWNTFYIGFVLGLMLSDWYNSPMGYKPRLEPVSAKIALAAGMFFGGYSPNTSSLFLFSWLPSLGAFSQPFYNTIGAALVLIALLNDGWLQNAFSTSLPRFLGRISFSLYAISTLCFDFILASTYLLLITSRISNYTWPLILIASFVVSIMFAYEITVLVDEPATKLTKTIYQKYFGGQTTGGA